MRRSIVSGERRPLRLGQSIEIVDRRRIEARRRTVVGNGRRRALSPGSIARRRSKSWLTGTVLCSNGRSAGFAEIETQRSNAESSAPIDFSATLRQERDRRLRQRRAVSLDAARAARDATPAGTRNAPHPAANSPTAVRAQ
ncbi:hypothetical protein [Burkholderia multivorans]|uniref:hypothetical protein n=1 Tax=Burkholderia multivorans TaxID=87883 RepID=UPI0015E40697|nr:hypothetical protein [Burkholderia multivorans]